MRQTDGLPDFVSRRPVGAITRPGNSWSERNLDRHERRYLCSCRRCCGIWLQVVASVRSATNTEDERTPTRRCSGSRVEGPSDAVRDTSGTTN